MSEFLHEQQRALKEKQVAAVIAHLAHTPAPDVAMALRSSIIDARTYVCLAPLRPSRSTHTTTTHALDQLRTAAPHGREIVLNNAHVFMT